MMPELGFSPEDNDRLVASYSGGWQMRMCLGKILLKVRHSAGTDGGAAGVAALLAGVCMRCRFSEAGLSGCHGCRHF